MIRFAENLNKMISAGLGGALEAPRTEVAVGHCIRYLEASGPVASFESNIAAPIRSLRVDMQPIQTGSGDPSPENIRPITGRDAVTVTRTGKNLLPAKFYIGMSYNANAGAQFTPTEIDDVVQSGNSFTRTVPGAWNGFGMISEALPVGTYRCNVAFTATTPRSTLYVLDGDMKVTRRIGNMSTNGTWAREITIADGEKYIALLVSTSSAGTVTVTEPQIEIGSTPSAYAPYDGTFVTVQLGQTVYGGSLDVLTGILTVDRAMVTFDGSQPNSNFGFDAFPDYAIPRNRIVWSPIYTIGALGGTYMSDSLISDTAYTSTPFIWHVSTSGAAVARMFIGVPTTITSVADWQAYVTEHPISVIYSLAEPQTIQLTPAQLSTLVGANNIWSDAGDVTLEYPYYEETEGY